MRSNKGTAALLCFTCGNPGHKEKNCPQKPNNNHNNRPSSAPKLQQQQQQQQQPQQVGFLPPGSHNHRPFHKDFERHFFVPARIRQVHTDLITAVNDFHYAMMNDTDRNEFYYQMLSRSIVPGVTNVLEIGTGSGLLSMMAASLGAKSVTAIEGSPELTALARANIEANKYSDRIKVINKMSTSVQLKELPNREPADLLVSELFGTLLLGESALDYISDVRSRGLIKSPATILPRFGTQFVTLIECPALEVVSAVKQYRNFDLSHVNQLCDTSSCVFTKKYGFRMNTVPFVELSDPIPVVDVDFARHQPGFLPTHSTYRIKALKSGVAHAAMLYWKAFHDDGTGKADPTLAISTHPTDNVTNFARDMQWGQALQLLDGVPETETKTAPAPVVLEAGKEYDVITRVSLDSVILQFAVVPVVVPPTTAATTAPSS